MHKKHLRWCLGHGKHSINAFYSIDISWINIQILKLINITLWKILSPFPKGIIWILISCFWCWIGEVITSPLLPISINMSGFYVNETFAFIVTGAVSSKSCGLFGTSFSYFFRVALMPVSNAPGSSCLTELKSLNKYVICLLLN